MKTIVVGEACRDVIHKADGRVFNEHGGISYSIIGGAALNDGIEVLPVIGIHPNDERYFGDLFRQIGSLDLSGLYSTSIPTRRVSLHYQDDNNRWECSTQPIEPTPFERIQPFLPAEGIHINLISGSDIELDTLKRIRECSPISHVHLDLHNIVMEHLADDTRVRRPVPEYLKWCEQADSVQLNEQEAEAIDPSRPPIRELARKILSSGVNAVVITLAEKGVLLFTGKPEALTERVFQPISTEVVDSTGCGDVFGAAFLHGILLGKDFDRATQDGIEAATRKLRTAGPIGMLEWLHIHD